MSIRVTTYTSHPGAKSDAKAEVTYIKVEILSDVDDRVIATGKSTPTPRPSTTVVAAATNAINNLNNLVVQAKKELEAMGLLSSASLPEATEILAQAGDRLTPEELSWLVNVVGELRNTPFRPEDFMMRERVLPKLVSSYHDRRK